MTTYSFGEIILVPFPFTDQTATKKRPAVISDIDIAVISTAFAGNRYFDRRRIVPFRRGIDSRIDPIPFTPEEFAAGGTLIDEIKSTGKEIL